MACDNVIELFASTPATAKRAADAAIAEVLRIEAKYSRYRDDSVVTRINRAAGAVPVSIDTETAQLLNYADVCHKQSGGRFDITAGVLRRAWNFHAPTPPTRDALAPLLPLIGWHEVHLQADSVSLPRTGMEIDFGGFGKEYAADRAAAVLLAHGIFHACVNLGGDVVVTGPRADGGPWHLGIRHPRKPGAVIASLPIVAGAVATSGDYERFIEYGGRRHSHILDPFTGESVHGLASATAFASTCLVAGSLTTIALLKGEEGVAWLEASGAFYFAVDAQGVISCRPSSAAVTNMN